MPTNPRLRFFHALLAGGFIVGTFAAALRALEATPADDVVAVSAERTPIVTERVIAGGPDHFMTARHVRIEGTNEEIGRALADVARRNHDLVLAPGGEPLRNAAVKSYVAKAAPELFARMRGMAAAFDVDVADDAYGLFGLPYNLDVPGCSIVYYPPSSTEDGRGVLSRNYDFTTGTIYGKRATEEYEACTSEPYVVELYPNDGYASLYLCSYDLLGGTLDGINEAGLTVALAANDGAARADESLRGGHLVGLTEIKLPRVLLDRCATVAEAKALLLSLKHYYSFVPCHYVIADRHGDSFIFEYAYASNQAFITDGDGAPQCLTNHALFAADPPSGEPRGDSRERFDALTAAIEGAPSSGVSRDYIVAANRSVEPTRRVPEGSEWAPGRTLWHALYYPEEAAVEIDFYLGERPHATDPARVETIRSGYQRFELDRLRDRRESS